LRIAICDDDSACRIEVTQPVKEYIVQSSLPMELRIYENGTGLLQDARRTGSFDIYILDILMPLNNINHGIQLRELEQKLERWIDLLPRPRWRMVLRCH